MSISLDAAEQLDAHVDAWVAAHERTLGPLRPFAFALGAACDHSLLWHAIGAVLAAQRGDERPLLRLSGTLAAESAITNLGVKSLFRRSRPERADSDAGADGALPFGMRVPITSSFPSGHAAAATCAAVLLHDETGSPAWYALAAVVAASRVVTRMHHVSDVAGGVVVGLGVGLAARRITARSPRIP